MVRKNKLVVEADIVCCGQNIKTKRVSKDLEEEVKVGRHTSNDIEIPENSYFEGVSRYHCTFFMIENNVFVRNTSSTNTWILRQGRGDNINLIKVKSDTKLNPSGDIILIWGRTGKVVLTAQTLYL
jgi:pSer/pThr/pTyr-binding forkhead associated (FHA) protein